MDNGTPAIAPCSEAQVEFHGLNAQSHAPTWGQYGMWKVSRRISPNSSILNQSTIVEVGLGVDYSAIDAALAQVVARHESLRTRFSESGTGRPQADVLSEGAVPVNCFSYYGEHERVDDFIWRVAKAERRVAFDSASDLPLRAAVVDCPGERRYLVITCSHIAVDNYAIRLLRDELSSMLGGGTTAEPPAVELQPRDVAEAERSEQGAAENDRSMRYWRDVLTKAPAQSSPTMAGTSHDDDRTTLVAAIDSTVIPKALASLAAHYSSTPSNVLLAAISAAYARVSGSARVFFQIVCHNRRSEAARRYVGCTVQGGPFYLEVDGLTFADAVRAAARAATKAYLAARYDTEARDAVLSEVELARGVGVDIRAIISDELSMRLPRSEAGANAALIEAKKIAKDGRITRAVIDAAPSERINLHLAGSETEARVSVMADPACFTPEQLESLLDEIETVLVASCTDNRGH